MESWMQVVIFITDIGWAAVSAAVACAAVVSFAVAIIYLSGLCFSPVSKSTNALAAGVGLIQAMLFSVLLAGGSW